MFTQHIDPIVWKSFVDFVHYNNERDTLQLRAWTTSQNDPYCVDHPVACLFVHNETHASIVFLSEILAWKAYYPDFDRSRLSISPIEFSSFSYPSR